jgi:SAM-dependent methyltransferase
MDEGRNSAGGRYQLTYEVRFINQFLGNVYKPKVLLDVCCGSGLVSTSIQFSGSHTVGLDTDFLALKRFHKQSKEASLSQGDAIYMPFAELSIDCIVAIHCFDHLDRVRLLQECNRVLCGGGILILESLNRNSYKWALKKFLLISENRPSRRSREKWTNVWSCHGVLRAACDCGFDVQAVYGYNWIPFTQGSNSRLIKHAAFLEQALHWDHFFMISPRFLVLATKREISSNAN